MDKKKKDDVDYAAAYRQFMNFGHGRSLKQLNEDENERKNSPINGTLAL